jgi:nucleotide-binding universal stress UspA family protein
MPADAILEYARAEHIDLIVMATHGRGGASRFWLGSVADALVRRSGTPVLLLRPPADETARLVAPTVKNILVPLDGSELSLGILPAATSFARVVAARITLLRVVPTIAGAGVFGLVPVPELAAEEVARANAQLGEVARTLRSQGIDATPVVVESTAVAPAILEYAQRSDVDAIAIATHGRGGLGRVALGSVADKVVRGAPVPVLSLRPRAERAASADAAA